MQPASRIVAFRHDRMNRAVIGKLLKGLGITLFFVCLILVQNMLSRRAKLRLLDLEAALGAARSAIRSSTPPTPAYVAGELGVAFAQSDRLGGTVYDLAARDDGSVDLLLAIPQGRGVDAAFASIVLRDLYRRQGRAGEPAARVATLLTDYDASPLSRGLEILCAHFDADGVVRGVIAGLRPPVVIDRSGAVRELPLGPPLPLSAHRLALALRPFQCGLSDGAFAVFDDGLPHDADRRLPPAVALERVADRLVRGGQDPQSTAEEVVAEAVKRYRNRHSDDFFVLVVRARA